jgi:hypothetical protein
MVVERSQQDEYLPAGLQLRDQFPQHDIKMRAIDEAVQRTVLH